MREDVVKPLSKGQPRRSPSELPERYQSLGFKADVQTGRWMLVPCTFMKRGGDASRSTS